MFHHIEGIVSEIGPNLAVLDCGGIGFGLNVTMNTLSELRLGEKTRLFVSEAIGETNFDLYGFKTKSERRCFEMLLSVSGIGPKAAPKPDDAADAVALALCHARSSTSLLNRGEHEECSTL